MLPALPLACQTSALLLSYAPEMVSPSRTFTGNLTLRTRPLCALSYGDNWCARPGTLRIQALI